MRATYARSVVKGTGQSASALACGHVGRGRISGSRASSSVHESAPIDPLPALQPAQRHATRSRSTRHLQTPSKLPPAQHSQTSRHPRPPHTRRPSTDLQVTGRLPALGTSSALPSCLFARCPHAVPCACLRTGTRRGRGRPVGRARGNEDIGRCRTATPARESSGSGR